MIQMLQFYLDQATASISACALLYNSSLLARAARRSMTAGSSFNNDDSCFCCKDQFKSQLHSSSDFNNSIEFDHIQITIKEDFHEYTWITVKDFHSYLQFTQLGEEMIKQASLGLTHLAINNGLWNGVTQTCTYHIDIRQNSRSCSHMTPKISSEPCRIVTITQLKIIYIQLENSYTAEDINVISIRKQLNSLNLPIRLRYESLYLSNIECVGFPPLSTS